MTNGTTPRTHRQLREALKNADAHLSATAADFANQLRDANQLASTANRRAYHAERMLDHLGFEKRPDADVLDVMGMLDADSVWIPKADTPATIPVDAHEKIVDTTIGEVQAGTRRETLSAVIDALEIKGYARGGYIGGSREGELIFEPDRFWADIQTALEVRAERKNAEQRAATEAKVSKIGKQPRFATNDVHISAVALSSEDRDLIRTIQDASTTTADGSSYGAAHTLPKPKATKKKSKGDKK